MILNETYFTTDQNKVELDFCLKLRLEENENQLIDC